MYCSSFSLFNGWVRVMNVLTLAGFSPAVKAYCEEADESLPAHPQRLFPLEAREKSRTILLCPPSDKHI